MNIVLSNSITNELYLENTKINNISIGGIEDEYILYKNKGFISIDSGNIISLDLSIGKVKKILQYIQIGKSMEISRLTKKEVGGFGLEERTYEYCKIKTFYTDTINNILKVILEVPVKKDYNVDSTELNLLPFSLLNGDCEIIKDNLIKITKVLESYKRWIYQNRCIKIINLDNRLKTEYRRITQINLIEDEKTKEEIIFFSLDRKINNKYVKFEICGLPNVNKEGIFELDSMGNKLKNIKGVSSQLLTSCETLKMSTPNSYLLLWDKKEIKFQEKVQAFKGENILISQSSNDFKRKINIGDYIQVGETDLEKNIVKAIISDDRIVCERPFKTAHMDANLYVISRPEEDIESLIRDEYYFDIQKNTSTNAIINIMPFRDHRTIKYAFGAKRKIAELGYGEYEVLDEEIVVGKTEIYKIWLNGKILPFFDYEISDGKILITNKDLLEMFGNNICYIFYDKEIADGNEENYAIFEYEAFDTNYITESEYMENLYKFEFLDGFGENLNYEYYKINNEIMDISYPILNSKNNTLTFSSAIGKIKKPTQESRKVILDNIRELLRNKYNFRLIRYIRNLDRFVIYSNCSLETPENETTEKENDKINYTINFKNKIILKNRLFGTADWGTFSPFGVIIYDGIDFE